MNPRTHYKYSTLRAIEVRQSTCSLKGRSSCCVLHRAQYDINYVVRFKVCHTYWLKCNRGFKLAVSVRSSSLDGIHLRQQTSPSYWRFFPWRHRVQAGLQWVRQSHVSRTKNSILSTLDRKGVVLFVVPYFYVNYSRRTITLILYSLSYYFVVISQFQSNDVRY
jgi:hypothetical protein